MTSSDLRPPTSDLPGSIVLTDRPPVVALKREFYALDLRTEILKLRRHSDINAAMEYERILDRKAQIAAEIFGQNHTNLVGRDSVEP